MLDVSQGDESLRAHDLHDENNKTVTVYIRHKPDCANRGNPYWRRCRCTKYLYIYKNGASRQISARTRSREKAEQKAHKIRESFEPAKQLPGELRSQPPAHIGVEIRDAAEDFLKEIARLNREEATKKVQAHA